MTDDGVRAIRWTRMEWEWEEVEGRLVHLISVRRG